MSEQWFEGQVRSIDEICALASYRAKDIAELKMQLKSVNEYAELTSFSNREWVKRFEAVKGLPRQTDLADMQYVWADELDKALENE